MPTTELSALIQAALRDGVFPGLVYGVSWGAPETRQSFIQAAGQLFAPALAPVEAPAMRVETVFDLASLTKPLATALAMLCLQARGRLRLDDSLADLALGRRVPADKTAITLRHLLAHCSGLPAHRPYFETLRHLPAHDRGEAMLTMVLSEPLVAPPGRRALYSDLGYFLLGRIVEEESGEPFADFVRRWLYAPLGLEDELRFLPLLGQPRQGEALWAPTENCPWRGRVLRGEVHDDNAHALGGVAGQAGLFAPCGAVLRLVRHLLDMVLGRASHPHLRAADLQAAVRPAPLPPGTTWGLGFDTPSLVGSSAGELLSRQSFGHLGFTGTSFWCDPSRDLAVVLLSNRVHPTRDNPRIRDFRPRFHDAVVRLCRASGRGDRPAVVVAAPEKN